MQCEDYAENGQKCVVLASWASVSYSFQWELRNFSRSRVQLDVTAEMPRAPIRDQIVVDIAPSQPLPAESNTPPYLVDLPFMNNMDEISYWIYTRRAPCLMNYDNAIKRQNELEAAHCSKIKLKSIPSVTEEIPLSVKKKKRKLSILDDESVLSPKQQNVYFETAQQPNQRIILSSCKSDIVDSDFIFNIKNTPLHDKRKKTKLQKDSHLSNPSKRIRMVTSTPKETMKLRRSLRKVQKNNNSHLNRSLETYVCNIVNSNNKCDILSPLKSEQQNDEEKLKKSTGKFTGGDGTADNKRNAILVEPPKSKPVLNGQFEDLSDVSGFTANYIRSTKIHSTNGRNMRSKVSRNLVRESRQGIQKEDGRTIVCVNKSVNTGLPKTTLNFSTDSSQNVIDLVTVQNDEKHTKVSKSTSLLKFIDTKAKNNSSKSKLDTQLKSKMNLNVSFQSKSSSNSRYPKRHKNNNTGEALHSELTCSSKIFIDKTRKISKNCSVFNNSDRKENPEEKIISRTRSGRSIGLTIRQPENSVLVLNNSTEESTNPTLNVASANNTNGFSKNNVKSAKKKRISPNKYNRAKQSIDRNKHSLNCDSLRDKSGFSACFSDSDDDKPLRPQKFFC